MHNIKVNYSNIITFSEHQEKTFSIQVEASYSINNVLQLQFPEQECLSKWRIRSHLLTW